MNDTPRPPSFRTERLFVTSKVARALHFIARVEAAKQQQEPAPDAADALAESILRDWMDRQHQLEARQSAVRMAIVKADAPFLAAARGT